MFKEVQVVYGPVAKSVKEGEPCLNFDFPASPEVIDAFLQDNAHLSDESVVHRFKVKSDFFTPVSRDQVEAVLYSKAVERLTQDQAAALCEERYYGLYPVLTESTDTKAMSPVSKDQTNLVGFIRQVSNHWLVPIEKTTDFWLVRGWFEPEKEKEKAEA